MLIGKRLKSGRSTQSVLLTQISENISGTRISPFHGVLNLVFIIFGKVDNSVTLLLQKISV